ncbi:MAG: YfcC family protein [Thermoanaerobacteraceae bacterium]|nr:YfcC family protein [Thermoanaerobacteraceae bacterium]
MSLKVPHTYVLLFMIVIIAALATYFVPAGVYDRVEDPNTGRNVVDPDSFHYVDSTPVGFFDIFVSLTKGMQQAADIIFFIFIVGGSFTIIQATGAIEAGIYRIVNSVKGKEGLLIPIVMLLFSLGGATFGMAEETIVFIPIIVALSRMAGFDALTGLAMVSIGATAGFTGGFMNPFTVGVAQGIAELPLFSGIGLRIAAWAIFLGTAMWYTYRYAMNVKKDPSRSIIYEEELKHRYDIEVNNIPEFKTSHILVLLIVLAGFAVLIYGVFKLGWYIDELSGIFLLMGIVSGLVGGLGINRLGEEFVKGAKDITFGALAVGVARAVLVVMQDGQIIDTVIHGLASVVSTLPGYLTAVGMYVVQTVIDFIIPSGSGQAAATMPIMAPLADLVGITRQTAVLAFQYGDGFTNSFLPTSGVLLATLGMANIPYEKWFKWMWPLMLMWFLTACAVLIVAVAIGYGPF